MNMQRPNVIDIASDGAIGGATRRYEKKLGDLEGLYRDQAAFNAEVARRGADELVYYVNDQRYDNNEGSLIVGTSILLPGTVGEEYAMTRGHLHAIANRAELYYCLSGHGLLLMDSLDGESVAAELTPGKAVNVPGHWVHRSVNVGDEPFVTLFCYCADSGQDYGIIAEAGGMRTLIVKSDGGWAQVPNPDHTGYRQD
ncbi:glucose-6-phosphate isomerase family protein [uncultured Tessaracoccus sp.]|uniref:glucose-6-phosphate isomerase family protein n=1 Tax=uncultured Tessaracoccus sp. TaxID=905023 RepID=UPI0026150E5F|nr:glucose-6-phosphate isomerase family protein [uncultured Tessaracoccus sp.]